MKNKNLYFLALSSVLLLALSANASLVEIDYLNVNDKLLTLDTTTNLEWLDLTQTAGLSYIDITNGIGGYLNGGGFRYASINEVGSLFENAGLLINQPDWLEGVDNAQSLLNMVGSINASYPASTGFTSTPHLDGYRAIAAFGINNIDGTNKYQALARPDIGIEIDRRDPSYGSWLVRPSAVPEPTSVLLLVTGSISLILYRNRKKAQPEHGAYAENASRLS